MNQLELFPKSEFEIEDSLRQLKVEIGNTRRGAFQQISELKKDYEFLLVQVEILTNLLKNH